MFRSWILVFAVAALTACSVVQATSGPESRDLSVLDKGTDRFQVLAELGQPVVTEKGDDGRRYDIFSFKQGQHGAAKAGKAVFYGVAAVATLGISELITSPLEGAAGKGAQIKARVIYDGNNKVDEVEILQDDRWIPVQELSTENES